MSNESRYLYEFGGFRLNPAERLLLRDGVSVSLPPKAFATLVLLVERNGRVLDKQELMAAVWPETFVEENNLTQCISTLRKALSENGGGQGLIETVPKLGYRFVEPVRRFPAAAEGNGFASIRHSRIVVRQEEEIEEEELTEPASAEAVVEASAAQAAQRVDPGFQLRYRTLFLVGLLLLAVAIGSYWWLQAPQRPQVLNYSPIARNIHFGMLLATDDASLYFTLAPTQLAKVSVTGGEPVIFSLKPASLVNIVDFFPARTDILALGGVVRTEPKEFELVHIPGPAGAPLRIGDLYAGDAAWSSDGKSVLYAHENGLYIARRDGSLPRLIARLPGTAGSISPSPDDKWIRFLLVQNGSNTLWEVAADGSHLKSLLPDDMVMPFKGRWTADGSYFLLPLYRDGRADLWALPRTRDQVRLEPIRLTNGPMNLAYPVISKDGKKVFAVGWVEGVEILRHDPATNSLAPFLPGVSADSLAFSSDGQWVAYSTFPERTLWRSRVDGSERLQLTFAPMESLMPRWSPDGKTIAFMGRSTGEPWQIRRISPEGGPSEVLMASPDHQATPSWSPDGSLLAYGGAPWQHGFISSSTAVHCLDLRTHQLTTLPDSLGLWSPRWSPDGRYLVAETIDSQGLTLFDFHTRKWKPLAMAPGEVLGYSAWSHDSKYVYFNAYGATSNKIYRVPVDGAPHLTTVLDLKDLPPGNTLGSWFTLAPDDSPLVVRDSSVRNIYALDMRFP